MTWTTAAAWATLAAAVWTGAPEWPARAGIAAWLLVLAAIFVVLPFVPTTFGEEKATTIGRLHMLAAVAWFAIIYSCMDDIVSLADQAAPGLLATVLLVFSQVTLAGLVLSGLRSRVSGISEGVFIVVVNLVLPACLGASAREPLKI